MTHGQRAQEGQGEVVALFDQQEKGEQPRAVAEATALPGRGLAGDMHAARQPGSRRQVLLVDQGDLSLLGLKPGDLREQITVRMPGLMGLPSGARLTVGEAVLEITGVCEPCTRIGGLLGRTDPETFRQELVGHRGMVATVTEVHGTGRIRVGDRVSASPPAPSPSGMEREQVGEA